MSKVDERIVEMKFENQGFEKNVDSSISALERLKSALNFNGAEKSIASVEKSVNGVDFSRISANLDALTNRFSAWGIAGMTVIQDLTHAAENLGKQLFNATVGQIKRGGWSRATNIDQAKFMLEGLGVQWADIKDDIDYGVADTAYGMDAAAKAASQLKASGVELGDEMKSSLRAISGVAAMTNSSYEEISPIFTTIAGQGKVMTMQLRQLETRGLNVAAELGKQMGKTEEEIRDMVTKGKIGFKEFSDAMDAAYGKHAKEANKTFEGSMSNLKAALSRIGQNFAAPIRSNTIGILNTLREIVNTINKTKLGQLYKDFEDFAYKVSNFVQNVLKNIDLSFIDTFVDKLHEAYMWFDTIMTEINPFWKGIESGEDDAKKAVEENTKAVQDYAEIVERVRRGEYGNGQARYDQLEKEGYNWKVIQNMINEAEGSSKRYEVSEEEMNAAMSKTNDTLKEREQIESSGRKASRKAYTEWMEEQQRKAGVESKGRKTSRAIYEEYAAQQKQQVKAAERQKKMRDTIQDLLTRLTPVAEGIASVFSIITKAVGAFIEGAIDPAISIFGSLGSIILDILGVLGLGATSLEDTMNQTDAFGKITEGTTAVLGTFAEILKVIADVVHDLTTGGSLSDVFEKLFSNDSELAGATTVGETVTTVFGKVKEFVAFIKDYLMGDADISFGSLLSKATELFPVLARSLPLLLTALGGFKIFKSLKGLSAPLDTLKEIPGYVKSITQNNNTESLFTIAKAIGLVALAFWGLAQLSWDQVARGAVAIGAITVALGGLWIILSKFSRNKAEDSIASIFGADGYIGSMAANQNANAILKIAAAFAILAGSLFMLAQLSWEDLGKAGLALVGISAAIIALMAAFKKTGGERAIVTNPLDKFLTSIAGTFKGFMKKIGTGLLLAAVAATVIAIGHVIIELSKIPWDDGVKALAFMGIMFGELFVMTAGLSEVANNTDGDAFGVSILLAALALIADSMGKTVKSLSRISWDSGIRALVLMGLLLGELFLITAGLSEISNNTEGKVLGVVVLMAAMAIVSRQMSGTIKELSEINFDAGIQGLGFMAALLLELMAVMMGLSAVSKLAKEGSVGLAILMAVMALVARSMSHTITDLAAVSWDDGIKGLTLMGLMLGELWAVMWGLSDIASNKELKGGKGSIAILMATLAFTAKSLGDTIVQLSTVSWDDGAKALVLMGIMMGELFVAVAGLSAVSKGAKGGSLTKTMGLLIGFGIAIRLMSNAIAELAGLNGNSIAMAMAAVTYITVLVGTLLAVSSNISGSQMGLKAVLPIVVLLAGLTGALYLITNMDQANLSSSVKALIKVVLSLSVALVAMSKLNGAQIKAGPIIALIGTIAVVVGAMYLLGQLDVSSITAVGDALMKVFASVAAMIAATSLLGRVSTADVDAKNILAAIGGIGLIIAEVSGSLALLTLLPEEQVNKLEPVASSLKEVLSGVALVVAAFGLFSALGGSGENGAEEKALIDAGNAGTIEGISKTSGIGKIIAIISAIIMGVGALDVILEEISGGEIDVLGTIARILEEWNEPLRTLGAAVGNLIGGLAGGIVEGLTGASVSEIAEGFISELKDFPATLDKWISGLSDVANTLKAKADEGAFKDIDLNGIKEFMNSMLEVADDIYEISKRFYLMKHSFDVAYGPAADMVSTGADITVGTEDLGYLFTSWAEALMGFSNALTAQGFNKEAANGAITIASDILGSFSGLLGNVKEIGGEGNFAAITDTIEALPQFASALVRYSWSMTFLNGEAVTATEEAVKLINALAGQGIQNGVSNVSVEDGVIGWLGKNGTVLESYSKDLPTYANALVDYAKAIDGMKDYTDAVSDTRVAVSIINELAGAAIDTGLKSILGVGNDMSYIPVISSYSGELESFAGGMVAYSKAITGLNPLAVLLTSGAVEMINSLASAAPNVNYDSGLFGFLKNGGNKLKDLGSNLGGFGEGLAKFSQSIGGGQFDSGAVYNTSGAIKYLIDTLAELNTLALGGNGQEGLNTFDTDIALSTLDGFLETVADHFTDENVIGDVETIKGAGRGIVQNFMQGIADGFSEGFDAVPVGEGEGAVNLADKLVNAILGKSPKDGFEKATTRGKGVINAFFNGATEGIEGDGKAAFAESLTAAIESVFTAAEESGASYRASGISFMTNLAAGIRSGASWPKTAAYSVLTATVASIKSSGFQQFGAVGRYWMQGLKKGIEVEAAAVKAYLVNKANEMVTAFKEATRVESPSKVFAEIGGYWMQGLANGINAESNSPLSALERVASTSFDTMEDNMSTLAEQAASSLAAAYLYINQVVQDSMNASPVITPVLDLSMMQNGLYAMNGMMPGGYGYNPLSYSMNAFPGSYSYGYSQQAMGQSSLEAELRGLRSDVKALGEAMTTMGITLDSGVMVGALTPGTDRELGNITKFKERWA